MIRVQREDFDVGAELARLTDRAGGGAGGLCPFVGLVRDINAAAPVAAMTLEHYPGMTERELAGSRTRRARRWPLIDALIVHRYGRLEPGDRIVLVAVDLRPSRRRVRRLPVPHRPAEDRAPFWKSEETAAGAAGSRPAARTTRRPSAGRTAGRRADVSA